ncbi:MAG TPA: J domain-containing protein [Acidocella sp.]|nr:MAG: molecular chaperone DnaJ [Acidocella sp. 21-58-7]HQT63753.1 J domain-containing protein [Acidocella sp.]HQU03129.1 J domain-containing protein [Acidocella sp.]
MADDLYKILGVAKTATADEIRSAYRKLAKKHHPDLNPGNKAAEDKFKSISAANELLSDPAKRARYDAGEIDETGAERAPQRSYRDYADGPAGQRYRANGAHGGFGGENFEDLFSSMFSGRAANPNAPARGQDAQYVLTINFLDAINGATNRLTLPDGQTLDVKIPPGTEQDAKLRLRGRGAPGRNGGPAGDALIEINIKPHEFYQRDGQDIRLELPITLTEAVLGAKITVPTPAGAVAMTIKPHTESGTELRLRGRGVPAAGSRPAGDLYVKLRVLIGTPDAALEDFLRGWKPEPTANPRAAMEAAP